MELTSIHPGVYLLYYLLMVIYAFVFSDPYFVLTFLALILILIALQGVSSELKNIMKFFIPLSLLIIVLNPLLNKTGAHRIYLWSNFFLTYEAIAYGIMMSLALLIVILIFSSYNRSVSYQEMLYIFSKKLPIISMIIVMALRYIPLINSRAIEVQKLNSLKSNGIESEDLMEEYISDDYFTDDDDVGDGSLAAVADDEIGDGSLAASTNAETDDFSQESNTVSDSKSNQINLEDFDSNISSSDSKLLNKIKSNKRMAAIINEAKLLGKIMGITVSWSLEESMFTAKSMRARGYNSTKRTSYLSYKFSSADYVFLAIIIITGIILIDGFLSGYGMINIYPSIDFSFGNLPFNIYYFALIVFLLPLIYLEIKERVLWH